MKKTYITFGSGVVTGVAITLLCLLIMRKPVYPTDLEQEVAYTHAPEVTEVVSDSEPEATHSFNYGTTDRDITNTNTTPMEVSDSFQLKDDDGEFTLQALELANRYLISHNNDEWHASTFDSATGIHISIDWGLIRLEGEDTPIRTEERIVYDAAEEAYMSGEWDGLEMVLDGHTVKLKEGDGYILVDGYIAAGQCNLDLPEEYEYDLYTPSSINFQYVPGQGTYAIMDKKLVKFLRGEQIILSGGELSWEGVQCLEHNILNDKWNSLYYNLPRLRYNKISGKLYLISSDETNFLDGEDYVYVFNDCNISEIEYLGKVDFEQQYPGNVDIEALINQNK